MSAFGNFKLPKGILGNQWAPGVDITAIVRRYNLPDRFSKAALDQANAIAIEPVPKEIAQRLDLREQVIVTIDGADARDFDDAVSCETLANGNWRLGVHIADVAYYLDSGSCLDLEARERGTSVYLPDRVLHMLPEPLSCGVCSLVPKRDRYTVSAFMEVPAMIRRAHLLPYRVSTRRIFLSSPRMTKDGIM